MTQLLPIDEILSCELSINVTFLVIFLCSIILSVFLILSNNKLSLYMSNLNLQNKHKKIFQQWIIANLIGFCASIPSGFGMNWLLNRVFIQLQSNKILYIILVYGFIGIIIGIAQWVILRKYFPKISTLWILSNALAFPLSVYTFFIIGINISNILFPLFGDVIAVSILAAIASGFGGAIAGLIQWLLLKKSIVHRHFAITWISSSLISSVLAGFISVAISVLIHFSYFPWNWIELAITSAILYSVITGRVLYWFLLNADNQT